MKNLEQFIVQLQQKEQVQNNLVLEKTQNLVSESKNKEAQILALQQERDRLEQQLKQRDDDFKRQIGDKKQNIQELNQSNMERSDTIKKLQKGLETTEQQLKQVELKYS